MSFSVRGMEGMEELARDLSASPRKARSAIRGVINRGGLEMKRKMQADFKGSSSFGHIGRSVTYDVKRGSNPSVEVGPDASRSRSAPLAGIAYFGGSRGGGGTVPEPDYILEAEAETAAEHIGRELRDLL